MKRAALLLALLVALDALTTTYALSLGLHEAGPLASRLLPVMGPLYFILVEYPVLLALVFLGRARGRRLLEAVPFAAAALAVANNLAWIGGYTASGTP